MARLAWSMKGPDGINLVTDAMAAAGMPDGAYKLGDFAVQVKDGAVRLPDGTLAGSSLTLDRALRNLIRFTGCSLEDAVTTVTRTPARVLGNREVHIAAGEPATLTALSPECEVTFTMRDGRPLFD